MESSLPKISIVTPSFNQGQFLEATIKSIVTQEYPNLEYIIIDGGSTDGSVEIIEKYERFIHFWCSEPDNGHYDAINKGFAHATGDIMAWLNSDDMYFPWALKTVASIMTELPEIEWLTTCERGKWDWHGFCVQIFPINGYSREAFLAGEYLPATTETSKGCIQQESTFWRRSLWEKIGGKIPLTFPLAADFDLWSHFYDHAELYATTSPLGGFRCQSEQRSGQIDQYIAEAAQSLDNMRRRSKWKPSSMRRYLQQCKFHRMPNFHAFLSSRYYYYAGKRVERQNPELREGFWGIREYAFL